MKAWFKRHYKKLAATAAGVLGAIAAGTQIDWGHVVSALASTIF